MTKMRVFLHKNYPTDSDYEEVEYIKEIIDRLTSRNAELQAELDVRNTHIPLIEAENTELREKVGKQEEIINSIGNLDPKLMEYVEDIISTNYPATIKKEPKQKERT